MKSEFCSSPPDPTPPNRTLCSRTLCSRAFRARCVARRGEAAPGPSCSPKSGDRAPASVNPSGFGQYIRPGFGLLDDALELPDFRAGAASTPRDAPGFPWSSTTSLHDPGSSSPTCARSLPYSRWQLSTLTRHEERKPLVQFDVHSGCILGLQNSPFSPWYPALRSAFAARRRAAARCGFCNYIIPCGYDKFRARRRWPPAAKNDKRGSAPSHAMGANVKTDRMRFVLV